MFCLEYYWIQMKLLKVQFALCCIKSHFIYVKMINQMFFSAKHYYRLMHDVDKDKFQFRFGKQTTVDFLDLYNGCHINTCQTPTPLNWYNYHLHVCFNGRLNLSVRLMKKSSHVEINLSNQFCPQLSRSFK